MVAPVILREIFTSVQGEGPYVGCRHLFVRFVGCNLGCGYCDTPREVPTRCRVEMKPGSGKFVSIPNPLTPEEVGVLVSGLNVAGHHAVSLTGGEPLLYPDFIKELIPHLRGAHRGVYLETNGTLVEEMKAVVDLVDVTSMDIKLPSATGMAPFWETHARFLEVARKKEVILKAVVSAKTSCEEVSAAAELAMTAGSVLVLQPITGNVSGERPTPAELLKLQAKALEVTRDVRVIPQVHRLCGML